MRFTASSKPWKYVLMKKMCTYKKGALNNLSLRYVHFAIRHILKSKGAGRHVHPGKFSYLQHLGLLWLASEATYMYTLIVQAKCTCTYCQNFLKWREGKSQSRSPGPLPHSLPPPPQYVLHHWGGGGKGHPEMKHGYAHVHCKYNTV